MTCRGRILGGTGSHLPVMRLPDCANLPCCMLPPAYTQLLHHQHGRVHAHLCCCSPSMPASLSHTQAQDSTVQARVRGLCRSQLLSLATRAHPRNYSPAPCGRECKLPVACPRAPCPSSLLAPRQGAWCSWLCHCLRLIWSLAPVRCLPP